MNREAHRQRLRRRRARAHKIGLAVDGPLVSTARDTFEEELEALRVFVRDGPAQAQKTAQYIARLDRRLRYRNRKGYSAARKRGIHREMVGSSTKYVDEAGPTARRRPHARFADEAMRTRSKTAFVVLGSWHIIAALRGKVRAAPVVKEIKGLLTAPFLAAVVRHSHEGRRC
jgi:hypothetical protein